MAPITAQMMIDIQSSAARPLPKLMLAKAAKMARMIIRRKKRTITWVDLISRDRSGSFAKLETPTPSFAA